MQKTIEVVYEKGVFKPLEPVELEEGEETKMKTDNLISNKMHTHFYGKNNYNFGRCL